MAIDRKLIEGRHRAVADAVRWLDSSHLSPELQAVAQIFEEACEDVLALCKTDDPMVTRFITKLIEAKDAAVRAKIVDLDATVHHT